MHVAWWLPWVLAAVLVVGVLNVFWLLVVRWWYRLRAPPPELLRTRCQDGWELTVYLRRAPTRRYEEPVLLCHGLAANRYTFDFEPPYSLSHVLAEAGFDCFIVEWRGIGGSRPAPRGRHWPDVKVDDLVAQDGPALIDLALAQTGARRAFWVGHSLGGLVGYAVAQGPRAPQLAGLIALGSPVFFPPDKLIRRLIRAGHRASWPRGFRNEWLSRSMAPLLGYVTLPLSDVVIHPKHIPPAILRKVYANMMASMSRNVLRQFQDWIDHDAFRSFDHRVDWRAGLPQLALPVLVLGGSKDRLAPPANLRAQFELVGSADKQLHIFGCERGDKMDYGHGDLLFGASVAQEVHDVTRAWLGAHATAWADPPTQGEGPVTHGPEDIPAV